MNISERPLVCDTDRLSFSQITLNSEECQTLKFKKNPKFHFVNFEKQMVPGKSTAEEISFEWSHHRISSTDSKVKTILHVSIIAYGSESCFFIIRINFIFHSSHYILYLSGFPLSPNFNVRTDQIWLASRP